MGTAPCVHAHFERQHLSAVCVLFLLGNPFWLLLAKQKDTMFGTNRPTRWCPERIIMEKAKVMKGSFEDGKRMPLFRWSCIPCHCFWSTAKELRSAADEANQLQNWACNSGRTTPDTLHRVRNKPDFCLVSQAPRRMRLLRLHVTDLPTQSWGEGLGDS